jgi:hypothetical protein
MASVSDAAFGWRFAERSRRGEPSDIDGKAAGGASESNGLQIISVLTFVCSPRRCVGNCRTGFNKTFLSRSISADSHSVHGRAPIMENTAGVLIVRRSPRLRIFDLDLFKLLSA